MKGNVIRGMGVVLCALSALADAEVRADAPEACRRREIAVSVIGLDRPSLPPVAESVPKVVKWWIGGMDREIGNRPDLIVLPEGCDTVPTANAAEKAKWIRLRGTAVLDALKTYAASNRCYIVYSALRERADGRFANSAQLIDRRGDVVACYDKVFPTVGESASEDCPIVPGEEAVVAETDFGRLGFAICFDLNDDALRRAYAEKAPDVIVFPSFFDGDFLLRSWARDCQSYVVSSTCAHWLEKRVVGPAGELLQTESYYRPTFTARINTNAKVLHLDENRRKFAALTRKYGSRVTVRNPGTVGTVTLLSNDPGLPVKAVMDEFGFESYTDYLARSGRVRLAALAAAASASATDVRHVDSFDLSAASCGLGMKVRTRRSVAGNPLTLAGKTYERGFGTRPESAVAFRADGRVTAFDALVGIDADAQAAKRLSPSPAAAAVFRVWADGEVVWSSGTVTDGAAPVPVHVALAGAKEIVLETVGAAPWHAFEATHADWADARFTCARGATLEVVVDPGRFAQLGVLTPPEKPEPQINGADIWGVRPGRPVVFRVATSGARPMAFTATGLPEGVTLDAEKGVLRGVAPKAVGNYDVAVTAANAHGRATRTIRLAVGETVSLTPPMGWNSWNTLCYRLTQEKAREAARAMDESGLGDHGWSYVNLDDWWAMNTSGCARVAIREKDLGHEDVVGAVRDAEGAILPNRSFPDMKGLTDYIHSLGFKAGLYSSPGPLTCGKCTGSEGHEMQDAARFAEWGFDYLKYDWCSYGDVFKRETGLSGWESGTDWSRPDLREAFVRPYRLMGESLRRQPRDIVLAFCQYGWGRVEEWARATGANSWRTYDDLKDQWQWVEKALDSCRGGAFERYAGPGCWADPDMMLVGEQFSFGYDHPSFLTPNEQYTHVSLWAMVCAPLLTGCDFAKLDAFTRSLLINDAVIAVSQDRLGRPARRIRHNDRESVWARPLADGDWAVALVNRYPLSREVSVDFAEVGAGEHCRVRDCWRQVCEGKFARRYAAVVPPHATKLVRLRRVDCVRCE